MQGKKGQCWAGSNETSALQWHCLAKGEQCWVLGVSVTSPALRSSTGNPPARRREGRDGNDSVLEGSEQLTACILCLIKCVCSRSCSEGSCSIPSPGSSCQGLTFSGV